MEAQGLVATFEQQLEAVREQSQIQADEAVAQALAGLRPPPQIDGKIKEAAKQYISELQAPWSSQEIVDVWAKYYGEQFSDADLDQLVAFYSSPLGQRDVLAGREASIGFSAEFQERYKPVQAAATQNFVERLQQIIKECNCRTMR